MASPERKKRGERRYSAIVSPPRRAEGSVWTAGPGRCDLSTRVCTRVHGWAPRNTQVAAAAGGNGGCQRTQTLELDIWNCLTLCNQPVARNRKAASPQEETGGGAVGISVTQTFLLPFPWMVLISSALDDLAGKGEVSGQGTILITAPFCPTASGHLPLLRTTTRVRRHSSCKVFLAGLSPNGKFVIPWRKY